VTLFAITNYHWGSCNINLFVSSWPRFENLSYAKHALAYRINWDIFTPQAGKSITYITTYKNHHVGDIM
jgi:hypothetical protein